MVSGYALYSGFQSPFEDYVLPDIHKELALKRRQEGRVSIPFRGLRPSELSYLSA